MNIYKKDDLFKRKIPIAIYKNKSHISESEALHTHDFIEISYILSGSSTQKIDNRIYETKDGDLLFMTIGQQHSYTVNENSRMKYYNILIDPDLINKSIISSNSILETMLLSTFEDIIKVNVSSRCISFSGNEKIKLENILDEMYYEYEEAPNKNDSVLMGYLMVLFAYIFRKISPDTVNNSTIPPNIINYIDKHFTENITLRQLSDLSLYSPKYFSKLFKNCYGISITEYIQRKRIDMGKQLLSESNYRIDAISEKVGYSNVAHFHKYFKKLCGVTPNEYRQQHSK